MSIKRGNTLCYLMFGPSENIGLNFPRKCSALQDKWLATKDFVPNDTFYAEQKNASVTTVLDGLEAY